MSRADSKDDSDQGIVQPVHAFLLKSKATSLKAAEGYLVNRAWTLHSSDRLRDALVYLIQKQPDYFFLPADYPNKKIKVLPRLIQQAFPQTKVIAYTESSTPSALNALKEIGVENVLYPPISGTTVERIIFRIQRGKEKAEKAEVISGGKPAPKEDTLIFKNNKGQKNSETGEFESAQQALQKFIQSVDDDPEGGAGYGKVQSDPGGHDSQKGSAGSVNMLNADKSTGSDPKSSQKKTPGQGGWQDQESDTVFVRGLNQAVRETVRVTGGKEKVETVSVVSNAVCIIVESSRFNGYLVAASPEPDVEFFDRVRKRLFEVLRSYGEDIKADESAMAVKLQTVEFEPWALQQAEFLKKAAHNGKEIAMAFFPTKDTRTELSESFAEHMVSMKMDDIREDVVMDFDLYIYMPENKKYLLYTPQGRQLFKHQKDRLVEKGMAQMHLRKDSSAQVTKYRAQNFINDRIREFREKRRTQAS